MKPVLWNLLNFRVLGFYNTLKIGGGGGGGGARKGGGVDTSSPSQLKALCLAMSVSGNELDSEGRALGSP